MQDSVRRYIETEYGCEVTELHIPARPTVGTADTFKVDGIAYRNGERLSVMGSVNPHNYSGVMVCGADDDPFTDLK